MYLCMLRGFFSYSSYVQTGIQNSYSYGLYIILWSSISNYNPCMVVTQQLM